MDYKECEKMAIIVLRSKRVPITDENIGIVINHILTANHKFNDKIGTIYGFRKMYIDFAIKTIKRNKSKQKIIYVEDYKNYLNYKSLIQKDFHENIFWDDIKKKLTEKEYCAIFHRIQNNKTLKEIGEEMQYSKEYVRILIKSALRRLKTCYQN
mgnify:CR=1 FL=1